jgi:hypothetical protein
MSYSDMKSKIEGELVSEPARIAAHVGACYGSRWLEG